MAQGLAPLIGVIVVALLAAGGLVRGVPRAEGEPVADFDHARHVEKGLECWDCHLGAHPEADSARAEAGRPSISLCAEECHLDDDPEFLEHMSRNENARLVQEYVLTWQEPEDGSEAERREPWWPALYVLPDHVVFSHRRHFSIGKIPCETCHGDIASATTLPERPVEATLTMDGCMECHARHGASQDCFACHK
ncbi:MAG: cytochrome c3 family protein [Planctomycetota bacterium]|jgi:hypothetical protein